MVEGEAAAKSTVVHVAVGEDEVDLRLDRWFKRHFPQIGHGYLEKMLRTGQVRVDGRRAKAGVRLAAGQSVRVPPMTSSSRPRKSPAVAAVDPDQVDKLKAAILYKDHHLIALNKPSGLAVQGGSGQHRHLDAMLDELRFEAAERPRLVHRLDKDTGGVLLLARNRGAAAKMTRAFRDRTTIKTYWALVVGVPSPRRGHIDLALAKRGRPGGEKIVADEAGRAARTDYALVEAAGGRAAWLAMRPLTGRTHQLRVHAAILGTPIVGDGKYGGRAAHLGGLAGRLHLHARSITIIHPGTGRPLTVTAPLTGHMVESWSFLGFDEANAADPFEELA